MDEIEAALDEANVLRFAANMRKMSSKSQMLVITHHRGYHGGSRRAVRRHMQEQGVSRVITIDLRAERTLKKEA
jgi:chromosome segregation protein